MKYVRNVIVMLVVIFLQLLVTTRAADLTILQGTTNKYSHATPTIAGWDYEWTENGYNRNRTYTEIRDGGYIYMAIFPTGAYQNQMLNFRQHKEMPDADILGFQIKASHTQNFGSMEYSASLWKTEGRYECAFQYWYGVNKFVYWTGNSWKVLPFDINQSKYLIWQITSSRQYTFKAECDLTNGVKPLFIQVNQYRLDINVAPSQPVPNKYSEFVSQHIQLNGDSKGSFGAVRVDTLNTFTYTR